MAKPNLSRELDQLVEALLARRDSAPVESDPKLARLASIAADLRDLPRPEFKARLKLDLERRAAMSGTGTRTAPAAGKVKPVPEGYHTVAPYLCVKGAAEAIEFYKRAFRATEIMRLTMPDGKTIGHAEIQVGDSRIMLSDEFPDYGSLSPQAVGGSPVTIHLYVEDVDAVAARAVAGGAKIVRPVTNQFYGDRAGKLVDPFGHVWFIATHIEDVSNEEIERRAAAYMTQTGAAEQRAEAAPSPKRRVKFREGFTTVTPYLTTARAADLVEFVKQLFDATETFRATGSAGELHAEVRIGNSMLMIGGKPGMASENHAALHTYVDDVDRIYPRALEAGATSIRGPEDHPYGERGASLKDAFGNYWYIATPLGGKPIPEGLRNVTPYLHPRQAGPMIDFLKRAFGAEELARYAAPDGRIMHAAVRIGDAVVEMGEPPGPYQPMPAMIYLYVDDADAVYRSALAAGAESGQAPTDQPYGDRNAFVRDPFGHTWYMATPIEPPAA